VQSFLAGSLVYECLYSVERKSLSPNHSYVLITAIKLLFLISDFRHFLNVVCFLLGDSAASEVYI
jgi:hypothetical protein